MAGTVAAILRYAQSYLIVQMQRIKNKKILTCTVLLIRSIIRHHNRPTGVLLDAAIQQS